MAKSILVIGATGKQGYVVVKALLEAGWHVRALTRNKDNQLLTTLDNERLEIFEGDLNDERKMSEAMKEQYGVYSVQPVIPNQIDQELEQGYRIIDIAKEVGIQHIVYSTAGGVNRNRTGPHFEALAKIERHLESSGLNYTIIKPSFFMDNFLRIAKVTGEGITIPEFISPDIKFAMNSTIDIAQVAVQIFNHPDLYQKQSIEKASDELTLNEVVQIFEKITGKPTTIEGEFVSGTAERSWLEENGYVVDFELMDKINPNRLSFEAWLKKMDF